MKPKARYQGKFVVDVCYGGYFAMSPDGQVEKFDSTEEVETAARAWFKKHAPRNAIGVGQIEWRYRNKEVVTDIGRPVPSSKEQPNDR